MKTYLYNTTKLYLVNQKSSRVYVLLHKIIAAGIIAKEEQLDGHKIDRSGVVSNYVGETEKNLSQIFPKVEPNNLVLLLDEADAHMANYKR